MGDMNCNMLTKPLDNTTKHIKRIYDAFGLTSLIKEPTRTISDIQTLIDHAITNRPNLISGSGVIPCGISDHDVIYIIRTARLPKIKSDPEILNVCNFKRFDTSKDLVSLPLDIIIQIDEDLVSIWLRWKTLFVDLLNKHAPVNTIRIKGNSAPYLRKEIKAMMYQCD